MTLHLGSVPANSTLYIPFHTFNSSGASVTITGLAVTDVEIYKNGSTTQRASDAGYALLDTDGIDFDGLIGIHGFSVDISDNTDAGFYSVGGFYWVVVSAITVDSQTVSFVAATFRIVAAEAVTGKPKVDVDAWLGTAAATPTVAGVPEVDITHYGGSAGTFSSGRPEVNTTHAAGTAWNSGAIGASTLASAAITSAKFGSGAITSTVLAANSIGASQIAADAIGASELAADAVSEIADAVWDEDATGHQTQGTFGQAIGDPGADTDTIFGLVNTNLDATVGSRASQTSVDTIDDFLDTEVAAIKAKTDNLPASPASTTDVTGLLTTQLTEAYAADGVAPTLAQALMLIQQTLGEFSISGTTLTVKKLNGSDTAATFNLDSSTAPTSITRAS